MGDKIGLALDDLIIAVNEATDKALADNQPVAMRALARRLETAQSMLKKQLGGLQGKLHAQAFGRN